MSSSSGWFKSIWDVSAWFLLVRSVVWQVWVQVRFFPHIFRLSPSFAAVENRDSETPLALFSHSDQICQKSYEDSLFPFVTLTHYRNSCKVKQYVMDAPVMYWSLKSSWESLGIHFHLLGTAALQLFCSQGKVLIREVNIKNTYIKIHFCKVYMYVHE